MTTIMECRTPGRVFLRRNGHWEGSFGGLNERLNLEKGQNDD